MSVSIGRGARLRAPGHQGGPGRRRPRRRRAGHRGGVHVQPLPVRPRLAGPHRAGGPRLRRPRRPRLAINPNDSDRYPRDSLERWRPGGRAAVDDALPARLHPGRRPRVRRPDDPDVFVLDAELLLRYRGAPDSDYEDPSLSAAVGPRRARRHPDGAEPARPETKPVGCSIKWKRRAGASAGYAT